MSDDAKKQAGWFIAGILGTILTTGLAAWLAFGGGVTRVEARQMIDQHAAFPHANGVSRAEFERLTKQLDAIDSKVDQLLQRLGPSG